MPSVRDVFLCRRLVDGVASCRWFGVRSPDTIVQAILALLAGRVSELKQAELGLGERERKSKGKAGAGRGEARQV